MVFGEYFCEDCKREIIKGLASKGVFIIEDAWWDISHANKDGSITLNIDGEITVKGIARALMERGKHEPICPPLLGAP
jgi:hypothetical protein